MRRVLLLMVLATGLLGAQPQGTVTVRNGTTCELYIVVNGRNQGMLAASSYNCYQTSLGDCKVEAYKGYSTNDPYAKKWVRLSASYPTGEVDFSNYDF